MQGFFLVGVAGFEPATPCSQSRCANRTALHPVNLVAQNRGANKKKCFYIIKQILIFFNSG